MGTECTTKDLWSINLVTTVERAISKTVKLNEELNRRLRIFAVKQDMSQQDIMLRAIEEYLKRQSQMREP